MNSYLAALAQSINGDPTYAWIITEDKINIGGGSDVGTCGPSDASDKVLVAVDEDADEYKLVGKTWTFRLYDDDGEHYFTGKLATEAETPEHDETGPNGALMAPLTEWGEAFGCTRIAWHGHPEWEIG